ncbi:putative sodium-coupled neutral amino acid transporter 10 [Condylostylus longicornis]|uniref:putative sodium-coupled neutral amino acid transporter 10 n=1 Tax=Condylostylus longicornis TaxID=2530218 RepID=UPI00244E0267|nr:putative sodium-coupled neutral amino acid transporter 10 [Condylostylus longicornis]
MLMTNMGHVMTLANSIIGVGILAMPFCFHKCGIVLSILLLVLNYLVTRISCYYLIRSALLARRRSFEFLGFYAFGSSGKLMVELCIIGYLIGTCIAYFVVVGDLGPRIIAKILDLNESDNLRTWVMIIVTILCIIPLGLLRNVDSLSAVSTASIGFYICLVLKAISESQAHLMANDWHEKVIYWDPDGILQCLPIFSMACSCQMQLFEVMETVPNHSLEKMNSIVKQSTKICTCVYIMVGLFGYIGFCTIPFTGNILIHFSPTLSSEVIKLGFVLSVAFSFPLVIFPCRVSIYSLIYKRGHGDASTYIPEKRFKVITVSIVLISLLVALMIPSIELVIGLVGSTIGVAICVLFPASVYLKMFSKIRTFEKTVAQVVLVGGFFLMILGTYANLNAIDEKRSGISTEATERSVILQNNFHQSDLSIADKLAKKEIEQNFVPKLPPIIPTSDSLKANILEPKLPFENPPIIKENPKLPFETNKIIEEEKISNLSNLKPPIESSKVSPEPPKPANIDKYKIATQNIKSILPNQVITNDSKVIEKASKIQPNKLDVGSLDQSIKTSDFKENSVIKTKKEENIKDTPLATNVVKTVNTNNVIDKDAIKKDEEIAAEEAAKDKDKKLEIAEAELQKTKELLEKKVDELKQEIVKQNEETQKLVNEKLSNIIEQVKEIKEEVKEEKKNEQAKIDESLKNNLNIHNHNEIIEKTPDIEVKTKFNPPQASLVAQLLQNLPSKEIIQKADYATNITSNEITKLESNVKILNNDNTGIVKTDSKSEKENEKLKIQETKEKVYEPLSYKTGEILNKINETKSHFIDNRAAIPLPLLINSTNNSKLTKINNDIDSNNLNQLVNNKNISKDLLNTTNLKVSDNNNSNMTKDLRSNVMIQSIKNSKITESNIEAIRRDILEVKETKTENNEKLNREKRDLNNFDYNLLFTNNDNVNCLPDCIKNNEPLIFTNLFTNDLNIGLKIMTGGRDLKSIDENNEDEKHSK